MLQSEKQNKKAKEEIKTAWNDGDIVGVLRAGIDSFFNLIGNSAPMSFQKFLEYTGISFDQYILNTSKQESLKYVGGKMILELGSSTDLAITPVRLSADFYFQTPDKKWVMKKKNGQVGSDRFTDWTTDTMALRLQADGKLELSIEPPEAEAK